MYLEGELGLSIRWNKSKCILNISENPHFLLLLSEDIVQVLIYENVKDRFKLGFEF